MTRKPRSDRAATKILVVDDDPGITDLIARSLSGLDFQVVVSHQMEHVLQGGPSLEYKVALIDVFMPGMGGIEGIRLLRQQVPGCRIIAMSGGWSEMTADEALRAADRVGADALLAKPFHVEDLEKLVRRMVDGEEDTTAS